MGNHWYHIRLKRYGKCQGKTAAGLACRDVAVPGSTLCRSHGGNPKSLDERARMLWAKSKDIRRRFKSAEDLAQVMRDDEAAFAAECIEATGGGLTEGSEPYRSRGRRAV